MNAPLQTGSLSRGHSIGLFRFNCVQSRNLVSDDIPSGSFHKAVDPENMVERITLVMKDGVLNSVSCERQLPSRGRKAVNDAVVSGFTGRCVSHLKEAHWLVFKPYFIRKLRVQQVLRVMADRRRLHWRHGVIMNDCAPSIVNEVDSRARSIDRERSDERRSIFDRLSVEVFSLWRQVQDRLQNAVKIGGEILELIKGIVKVCGTLRERNQLGDCTPGPYLVDEQTGIYIDPALIGDQALKLIAKRRKRSRIVEKVQRFFIAVFNNDAVLDLHCVSPVALNNRRMAEPRPVHKVDRQGSRA